MRALISRDLPAKALDTVRAVAEVSVWPHNRPPTAQELVEHAADADGILCLLTDRIDDALLSALPKLRIVSQMAVGVDNIDLQACANHGVAVGNTPGVLTDTTADLAVALLLATARRVCEGERFLRAGEWTTWSPMLLAGAEVHGATIGIVGMGRIGFEVARRAAGFKMRIVYTSRSPKPDAERLFGAERRSLSELLAESDFVSVHTPLSSETTGLIGAAELAAMKPSAILINTARGAVVSQRALYDALKNGRISAAGLDVFEREPIPMDDPLLTLPNVVMLPHIGSATVATRTRMAQIAADNLAAGLQGLPMPHPVALPVRMRAQ